MIRLSITGARSFVYVCLVAFTILTVGCSGGGTSALEYHWNTWFENGAGIVAKKKDRTGIRILSRRGMTASLGLRRWREESPETETVTGKEGPGSRDIIAKVSTKRNGGLSDGNARVSGGKMAVHGGGIQMSTVISLGTEALLERMSLVVKQGGSSVSLSF